jgi:hypothetical protein
MDETTCSSGCGRAIDLSEPYVVITRQVERQQRRRWKGYVDVEVLDADVLHRYHRDCAPSHP